MKSLRNILLVVLISALFLGRSDWNMEAVAAQYNAETIAEENTEEATEESSEESTEATTQQPAEAITEPSTEATTQQPGTEKSTEAPQVKNGWYTEGGKKYYYSSGTRVTGWKKINDKKYYFNANGVMKTGWLKLNGKKYYLLPKNGKMVTGRQKIGKKAYYFNKNGVLKNSAGWIKDGKKTYYSKKNGVLISGWKKINGKKYYFSPVNNNMLTGWKVIKGYKYYFSPSGNDKGVLQTNCIVGSQKGGYSYVDASGIRVTAPEVVQAVSFVVNNTEPAWTSDQKLRACYDVLWNNYAYQRFYDTPAAESMPGYANYMFTYRQGNCYRYAASLAYIARVLGYDSRVAVGGISSNHGGMTPHGWAEIYVNGAWYIFDANMQKNFPTINSYMCTEQTYAYPHSCSAIYTLEIQKGKVSWR